MKKFISHFVSFFLVAVMIVSSNITAFAANEKPVDSRFLPEITYTEDNTSTTRVPNLIPITVNPYYNKLVVHVGNLGVDSIDSVAWKETQAKSNVFSILLAFQTLSSRQLNNRGFSLIILNLGDLVDLPTKPCAIYSRAAQGISTGCFYSILKYKLDASNGVQTGVIIIFK